MGKDTHVVWTQQDEEKRWADADLEEEVYRYVYGKASPGVSDSRLTAVLGLLKALRDAP